MSKTTPISLVDIVRIEDGDSFIVKSPSENRQMPQIKEETIPACLDKIEKVFEAAHNGETEFNGTSIVWIKDGGNMTVRDPNQAVVTFTVPDINPKPVAA